MLSRKVQAFGFSSVMERFTTFIDNSSDCLIHYICHACKHVNSTFAKTCQCARQYLFVMKQIQGSGILKDQAYFSDELFGLFRTVASYID